MWSLYVTLYWILHPQRGQFRNTYSASDTVSVTNKLLAFNVDHGKLFASLTNIVGRYSAGVVLLAALLLAKPIV